MVDVPHLKVPFAIVGPAAAVVDQNSIEEIEQCVLAVVKTEVGQRIERPEFGIVDPTFEQIGPDSDADEIVAAIEEWEPRVETIGETALEEAVQHVRLAYATGD